MAGMHRDKGGASAVAGFMHAVNVLKPSNIKIIAGLAMVRNSVGSEAYLADEIITARSGKRVRVGNTDAEGRMAMVDLLCHAKERCIKVSSRSQTLKINKNSVMLIFYPLGKSS